MKKASSILIIVLMLVLTGCHAQMSADVKNAGYVQSEKVTMLDEGIWPENEYTEGLPVPTGTVSWAMLDNGHKNCGINMIDVGEAEYDEYLELLKKEGFSEIKEVSEEVKEQGYVSIGMLFSNGEKGVSISYIPNSITIYISFEQ